VGNHEIHMDPGLIIDDGEPGFQTETGPAECAAPSKPRIGLIIDTDGWSFSNIALQLQRHLADRFDFIVIPTAIIDNVDQVLLMTRDCNLVHFFWREDACLIGTPYYRNYVELLGIPYEEFERKYINSKKITTAIYDHLLLEPAVLAERAQIFNNLFAGYYVASNKLRDIYQAIPCYPSPTAVLEDGVDLTQFQPRNLERLDEIPRRELVVGWVGNSKWAAEIEDFKGVHTILAPAIDRLRAEGFPVVSCFADRQERFIPHSEMPDYYEKIDLYVCTSKIEGTPNPILESMACGIPIVSTDVGIVPQAFGPLQQRFILEERSIDCLVEKLKTLLREPALLKEMSAENLKYITSWDWGIKARQFGDFFDSTLKGV
jgi:glycosyltransferase involved in cell wall biosynthesis